MIVNWKPEELNIYRDAIQVADITIICLFMYLAVSDQKTFIKT